MAAQRYLERIYYDPSHPASYQGPRKLYAVVKREGLFRISFKKIKEWLEGQEPYSLNRFARRTFPVNRVVVEGLDSQWDADLADLKDIKKENDGFAYWLVCIDIFSRYAFVRPLKTKTELEVSEAFESIFKEGRKPKTVRTDAGAEFTGRRAQLYFESQNIHHFIARNTPKANYAERLIKTLKSKVYRYIVKYQTLKYIDHLHSIVNSYNKTRHSALGMPPKNVKKSNEKQVRYDQYTIRKYKKPKPSKFQYRIGDKVRITYSKEKFDREYGQKFSGEVFTVSQRRFREGLPVYFLKDYYDVPVEGSFYGYELQKAHLDENSSFKIEKILKRRSRNGRREVLVKWLHWPNKFNQWIDAEAVEAL